MTGSSRVQVEVLRAIADGLRQTAEGLSRLAAESSAEAPMDLYTSEDRPSRMSRRRFARRCRDLSRAGVDGVHRNGRIWVAQRSLFDERASIPNDRPAPPAAPSMSKVTTGSRAWSAAEALRQVGAQRVKP
jgi:hypothetical protein